ncbi:MAG: hypothetical protein AAF663_05970, partial [Planctomycetota bacterium]
MSESRIMMQGLVVSRWMVNVRLAIFCLACAAAWALGSASASADASVPHRFVLDTTGAAQQPDTLYVSGTFNGWNPTAVPMLRDDDGLWSATVELPPGVVQYKFVVNGEDWINDPVHSDPTLEAPDGHGGKNSAVLIGEDARNLPEAKPNHLLLEAITHDVEDFRHRSVVNRDQLLLGLEVREGDAQQVMAVLVCPNAAPGQTCFGCRRVPMSKETTELGLDTWVALISGVAASSDEPAVVDYAFVLRDGEATHVMMDPDTGEPFQADMTPTF